MKNIDRMKKDLKKSKNKIRHFRSLLKTLEDVEHKAIIRGLYSLYVADMQSIEFELEQLMKGNI